MFFSEVIKVLYISPVIFFSHQPFLLLRVAKVALRTLVVHTLPHRSTQALLRNYSGHAQERQPKWFRQVGGALQKNVNSSRGLGRGTVSGHLGPEMGPLGNLLLDIERGNANCRYFEV